MLETIETEIREALIKTQAEETYQLFQSPKYEGKLINFTKTVASTTLTRLKEELDEDLGSVDEFLPEKKESLEDLLKPESLMKHAYDGARSSWRSRKEVEATLGNICKTLRETGEFDEDALSELKRALSPALEIYTQRDEIVQCLLGIAKREGVDKATTKEAQYKATRMIFPTAEEYMESFKKSKKVWKKLTSGVQGAFAMDGEVGKFYGAIFAGIIKGIEEIKDEVLDDWVKKTTKEIYNIQL